MAMYGNLDAVRAGTLDGLEHNFIHKRGDVGFVFGEPVFVTPGNETDGFAADVTDTDLLFQGVTVASYYSDNLVEGEYPAGHSQPVCTEGEIWVQLGSTVSGTDVFGAEALVVGLVGDADFGLWTDTAAVGETVSVGVYFTSNAVAVGETGSEVYFAKVKLG